MFAFKTLFAALFLVLSVVTPTSAFSLTAILTRRGKPAVANVAPSQELLDFNAQMAAIVAEERRDHYYPYVQQTSAFLATPTKDDAMPNATA